MRKKTKSNINSYTLMPNGIWIETDQKSVICWHEEDDYLLYSEKKDLSKQIKTPFLRAYQYLFNQLFGKYSTYRNIKKENSQIKNTKPNQHSIFQKLSITKILLTIVAIYYFTSLQFLIEHYIRNSFNYPFATIVSVSFEYLLLMIFLLLVFRLFVDTKDIQQISKYNSALKEKTRKTIRNNTIFMIMSIFISFYLSTLVDVLFHIDSGIIVFVIYPIVHEILNFAESKSDRYSYFLLYYPVYFVNNIFSKKPTKKEQKCVTLALK